MFRNLISLILSISTIFSLSTAVLASPHFELVKEIKLAGEIQMLPKAEGYLYLPKEDPVIQKYTLVGEKVWEYRYNGYRGPVAISPLGDYIAFCRFSGGKLILLDEMGNKVWEKNYGALPLDVVFLGDGKYILSVEGTEDYIDTAHLHDLNGKILWEKASNTAYAISKDENVILLDNIAYDLSGKILWMLEDNWWSYPQKLSGDGQKVVGIGFSAEVIYGSRGKVMWRNEYSTRPIDVFINSDGEKVIVQTENGGLQCLNHLGQELWRWDPPTTQKPAGLYKKVDVAVNFEKGIILIGANTTNEFDDNLYLLDMEGQVLYHSQVGIYKQGLRGITRVSMSPDGATFVIGVDDEHFLYNIKK